MSALPPSLQEVKIELSPGAERERILQSCLLEALMALSFQAYEEVVKELLIRLGYSDVRLLGRTSWKQYTRHGGMDMEAYAKVGISKTQVMLQLKQYRRPVSRRFVDELGGAILRSGAREGIIITTSDFSHVARTAAKSHGLAPIRLIDGAELTCLLITHCIGVARIESKEGIRIDLDTDLFERLHAKYPNLRQSLSNAKPESAVLTLVPTPSRIDSFNPKPMLWRTHTLAGITSLWLLYPLPGVFTLQTLPLAIIMASLGSLLPDIDAVESKIMNLGAFGITPFAPVSRIVNRSFGHRGITHSPIALVPVAVFSVVLSFWIGVVPGISLLLGYGSHLVMDALTRSGISLLPMSQKRLHLLPLRLRLVTGSLKEDLFMLILALAALLLLLHFLPFA